VVPARVSNLSIQIRGSSVKIKNKKFSPIFPFQTLAQLLQKISLLLSLIQDRILTEKWGQVKTV
jgi:hypothetical protein